MKPRAIVRSPSYPDCLRWSVSYAVPRIVEQAKKKCLPRDVTLASCFRRYTMPRVSGVLRVPLRFSGDRGEERETSRSATFWWRCCERSFVLHVWCVPFTCRRHCPHACSVLTRGSSYSCMFEILVCSSALSNGNSTAFLMPLQVFHMPPVSPRTAPGLTTDSSIQCLSDAVH